MFKSMRYIQLQNSDKNGIEEIKKIITSRNDEHSYAEIYPECDEPLENIPHSVDNSIVFSLSAENVELEEIMASKIVKDIEELLGHDNFRWDLCPGPVIRITFKKEADDVKRESLEKIFSKKRCHGVVEIVNSNNLPDVVCSFVFQIKCNLEYFDMLFDEVLGEIKVLEDQFDVCYYRHL